MVYCYRQWKSFDSKYISICNFIDLILLDKMLCKSITQLYNSMHLISNLYLEKRVVKAIFFKDNIQYVILNKCNKSLLDFDFMIFYIN